MAICCNIDHDCDRCRAFGIRSAGEPPKRLAGPEPIIIQLVAVILGEPHLPLAADRLRKFGPTEIGKHLFQDFDSFRPGFPGGLVNFGPIQKTPAGETFPLGAIVISTRLAE